MADKRFIDVPVTVFADWLAAMDESRYWGVDGDHVIAETISMPCLGRDLAEVFRRRPYPAIRVELPPSAAGLQDLDRPGKGIVIEVAWLENGLPTLEFIVYEDMIAEEAMRELLAENARDHSLAKP